MIICLGRSVLITGATFADLDWTPPVVAAFATAFIGTLAMWWIWFSRSQDAASERFARSDDTGRVARRAYTYAPILVVAGIVVTAVGDEKVLSHPDGPIGVATAAVLLGGPALFLIGARPSNWRPSAVGRPRGSPVLRRSGPLRLPCRCSCRSDWPRQRRLCLWP